MTVKKTKNNVQFQFANEVQGAAWFRDRQSTPLAHSSIHSERFAIIFMLSLHHESIVVPCQKCERAVWVMLSTSVNI
ncbi:hypothetical protein E2C01_027349 [Portunus trituberculatus]|uniref:Uncharacterized protein n=1 Tax=Portunus trituberculatus TaxID=210409 RepID=A0A5B7ELE5_PORTR|nr:hypothetical protein [Portunus trituberculatus]